MMNIDPDTKKVLDDQKLMSDWVLSDGWRHVKSRLMQKIVQNTSLRTIPVDPKASPETAMANLTAHALVAGMCISLIQDVEGDAASYQQNLDLLTRAEEEEIVKLFPGR